MPLLDIAIAQPCFQNNVHKFRSEIIQQNNLFNRSEKRLLYPWKYFSIPTKKANNFDTGRVELWKCRLMIKAVATLEPVKVSQTDDEELKLRVDDVDSTFSGSDNQLSNEVLSELNAREKLRRMKISKANKGNTPWNKGRKHSPETLKKIRERTRLAMQDPKVKMKLVNLGHAQSKETRVKIGVGVRIGWEKRRQLMLLQETCVYEWQNLIAEAGKTGFVDEEELQWDSFKILNQQLREEWLESIEERKRNPRPKMSKRAPKSLEQRRKISEAISAKWADPSYRDRVYSGLAKYHGTTIGIAKKPKQKPSEDGQTRKRSPSKKKIDFDISADTGTKSHDIERLKLKRSGKPLYKDPLVGAKLEMLKNIRAQRSAAESKKKEAVTRAKLLIAEAEKAAKALEVAAKKSPIAHASLMESRKLIAEAVQSIMSIDKGEEESQYNESNSVAMEDKTLTDIEKDVNGTQALVESSDTNRRDYNFDISEWQDLLEDTENVPAATTFNSYNLVNGMKNGGALVLDDTIKLSSFTEQLDGVVDKANHSHINGSKPESTVEEAEVKSPTVTKKWVRGRLVDVNE